MKPFKFCVMLAILLSMTGNKTFAYNISVQNSDGVMIYYNYINSGNELEVSNNNSSSKYEGSINIPNEVTYMGQTRDVTRIGNDAFDGCSGLTSITIPNSVTWIGSDAFHRCI